MPLVTLLVAVAALPRLAGACPEACSGTPAEPDSTRSVAEAYLRECFEERDMEGACGLMANDVAFIDPTAEVWGGPAYRGVVGRDVFRKLADSWNIERSHFEVQHEFVSGEYAIFAGLITWQAKGQPEIADVPFCTVLRVQDGAITERTDYGDYDDVIGKDSPAFADSAERFFAAYEAMDLAALDAGLAEDVMREDPIGASMGRPGHVTGKTHVLAELEKGKGVLKGLEFDTPFVFTSGTHAFVFGNARYAVAEEDAELELAHASVHVLRFDEGKVVQHRRYLDYETIDEQVRAQLGEAGGTCVDEGAEGSEGDASDRG